VSSRTTVTTPKTRLQKMKIVSHVSVKTEVA